jgi:hypothetical protein
VQGLFYDRFGVRAAIVFAALLVSLGYLCIFAASTYSPSPALLACMFFLIGQGSHGLYTVRFAI